MSRITRFLTIVSGVGLAYILLWNFATGRLNPVVYDNPWPVMALAASGVVMSLVAIFYPD